MHCSRKRQENCIRNER